MKIRGSGGRGPQETPETLEDVVVRELRGRTEEITLDWIDFLQNRLGVRPSRLLPSEELKDHVPDILQAVAAQVKTPHRPFAPEVVHHLRTFAELRSEQGYDVSEILVELGALDRRLSAELRTIVDGFKGSPEPREVLRVTAALHEAMREVDRVVVGSFREEEEEEQQALSERLAEFSRTLVHELKNPLNAAGQSARLLANEDLPAERRDRLHDVLLRSIDRIDDLLHGMLTLTDAEAGRSRDRWLLLEDVVREVFNQLMHPARSRGVQLEIEGTVPDVLVASRIEIALHNLVLNAIKYSDPDKDERWVRVSAERVDETAGGRGSEGWRVSVADNGLGIAEAHREQIFQRHFRAHPDVADGTGLGLSITRQVVDQRHGRIWFESEAGRGTTFHIEIPGQPEREEERVEPGKR